MSSTLPEEFTPEQRRLLARAYRLILSWPRDEQQKSQPQSMEVVAMFEALLLGLLFVISLLGMGFLVVMLIL